MHTSLNRRSRIFFVGLLTATSLASAAATPCFTPPAESHPDPSAGSHAGSTSGSQSAPPKQPSAPTSHSHETPAASPPSIRAFAEGRLQTGHPPKASIASNEAPSGALDDASPAALTADQALKLLQDGNGRWVNAAPDHPHSELSRRTWVAENGQHPFATILTCSDSRLPVERLFDCGVGDVFVLRVAGNVIDENLAGTIEYGAEHLHVPLLVVMGHTKCGAVAAAATDAHVEGNIAKLIEHIEPAIDRAGHAHPELSGNDLIPYAVHENVWQSVFDLLKSSSTCREMVRRGELKIVGAVCDISQGQVSWMGEHPWQFELIAALAVQDQAELQATAADDEH